MKKNIKKTTIDFWQNEDGATAIEYAMIASFVSVFIVVSVRSLGSTMNSTFYDGLINLF